MKRRFIILIASLFSVLTVMSEKYTIEFSVDEFRFETENSCMSVLPVDNFKYFYLEGDSFPCLPMHVVSVLLEPDQIVANYSFTELSQSVVYNNVTLATAPTPIPTSQIGNTPYTGPKPYLGASFPTTVLKYSDMGECRGNRTAYFAVSPFKYDAATKTLSLITKIELTVTASFKAMELPYHPMDKAMTKALINPELNDRIVERYNAKKAQEQGQDKAVASGNDFDYLIITNDLLKPAFEPLKTWKNKKGIRTEILTISEIIAAYSSDPLYLAIKKYIRYCYRNQNIKYVLLAGDETIIPAVICKAPVTRTDIDISKTIPADMFYVTFDKTFNWDKNANGVLGETNDNVDLEPEVYLSRISVNNTTDASNVVAKILKYETNPSLGYLNKMLLTGNKYTDIIGSISDVEHYIEKMYHENIEPYWNGIRHRLYDTNTDFGGAGYNLTAQHLTDILNLNYHFVNVSTHGSIKTWAMESGLSFDNSDVYRLQNFGFYSNIVSDACSVNKFDTSADCLSETFLKLPNAGAVTFFASSRESWICDKSQMGPSLILNARLYNKLFQENVFHFAELTTKAKLSFSKVVLSANYYRWLQYSLNAMGDPEMPIYTTTPSMFNNVIFVRGKTSLSVNTGISGCTIAVTSGDAYFQVIKNVSTATFENLPEKYDVVITKQNYVPFQANEENVWTYIQNETITSTKTAYRKVAIGNNVTNSKPQGDVVVKNNGKLVIEDKEEVLIKGGFIVELGGELEIK